MTPEQEDRLFDTLENIKKTLNRLPCEHHGEALARAVAALDGPPGNSRNPGLLSRVLILEEDRKAAQSDRQDAQRERERNSKWFRLQLGAVLAALLGLLSMGAVYFLGG